MRQKFTKAILCVFLSTGFVSCRHDAAQKDGAVNVSVAEEREVKRLFPAAGDVKGWKTSGKPEIFSGQSLYEHIDGGADIYFEYGFTTLAALRYGKDEKAVSIEIYAMKDPNAAFGIYSYNRHPSLSQVEVGSEGVIHPNGLFFWQARYYVDIRQAGPSIVSTEDFIALAKAVEQGIGTKTAPPEIIKQLPAEGKVPHTEVFARGKLSINNQVYVADEDLFGLGEGDAAVLARYAIGRIECSLIIADYSKEDECRNAFGRFREHFLGSQSAKEDEFVAAAMPAKYHGVRKIGRSLVVVANADSADSAIDMLGRVTPR